MKFQRNNIIGSVTKTKFGFQRIFIELIENITEFDCHLTNWKHIPYKWVLQIQK